MCLGLVHTEYSLTRCWAGCVSVALRPCTLHYQVNRLGSSVAGRGGSLRRPDQSLPCPGWRALPPLPLSGGADVRNLVPAKEGREGGGWRRRRRWPGMWWLRRRRRHLRQRPSTVSEWRWERLVVLAGGGSQSSRSPAAGDRARWVKRVGEAEAAARPGPARVDGGLASARPSPTCHQAQPPIAQHPASASPRSLVVSGIWSNALIITVLPHLMNCSARSWDYFNI